MTETIENLTIAAIGTCVPAEILSNEDLSEQFGEKTMRRFGKSTGISERRIAKNLSALDLCVEAAEAVFALGESRDEIDAVIFVSQTPEYLLPASAPIAQHRLGLRTDIAAFDINLGCSGYVYGLMVAGKLLAGRDSGAVLLLVGDTISQICSEDDRATRPIFGDAGSATIVRADGSGESWTFQTATDGSGADAIVVPASGFASAGHAIEPEGGEPGKLFMNGGAVFNFATTRVPEMITEGLQHLGWDAESIDTMVLHQANILILKTIARKVGVPEDRLLMHLEQFGNTSCASIPLAMTQDPGRDFGKTVLCGFGVGLSWATMYADLGALPMTHVEV